MAIRLVSFFFLGFSLFGEVVGNIEIECEVKSHCKYLKSKIYSDPDFKNPNIDFIRQALKFYLSPQDFGQTIISEDGQRIKITLTKRKKVARSKILSKVGALGYQLRTLRSGDFFNKKNVKEEAQQLSDHFYAKGFRQNRVKFEISQNKAGDYNIDFLITPGKPTVIKKIFFKIDNEDIENYIKVKMNRFLGKRLVSSEVADFIESLKLTWVKTGRIHLKMDIKEITKASEKEASLLVTARDSDLIRIVFKGNKLISSRVLLESIKDRPFSFNGREEFYSDIKTTLKQEYKNRSYSSPNITVSIIRPGEVGEFIHVFVAEKKLDKIKRVQFIGLKSFTKKELTQDFSTGGSDLINSWFFDKNYVESFSDILKQKYISNGFVKSEVIFDSFKEGVITYKILEGPRYFIKRVDTSIGYEGDLKDALSTILLNIGKPFNPILIKPSARKIENFLRNRGYLQAEVDPLKTRVSYDHSNQTVNLKFDINKFEKNQVKKIKVSGNIRTKEKAIQRYLKSHSEKNFGNEDIKSSVRNLFNTGVFDDIDVEIKKENVFLNVTEKKPGELSVTPGFRTDLGFRLGSALRYTNLGGWMRRIDLQGSVNYRLSLAELDERREREENRFVEYEANLSYSEPYFEWEFLKYNIAASVLRRRFFSFDANIMKLRLLLTQLWSRRFNTSLFYQFEDVEQEDVTNLVEKRNLQIGSLGAGLSWDLRNNRIVPTKGLLSSFQGEVGLPELLSENSAGSKIGYYKISMRNRFYIPTDFGTLALGMSLGKIQNLYRDPVLVNGSLRKEGLLPRIKLPRLGGGDLVRGYSSQEANVDDDGKNLQDDLSNVDKVYFTVFRIEPRIQIKDKFIIGAFFDAGNILGNEWALEDFRTSVGLSLKFITPVGTLDFDYGVKLNKRRFPDGSVEDPGRLSVFIGFF